MQPTTRTRATPDLRTRVLLDPGDRVGPPTAPEPVCPEPVRSEPEPWERSEHAWEELEPEGAYARRLRTPVLYAITLLLALPGALLAVPIVLTNLACHRSLRRVFFRQERVGRRGRVFMLYKFRTMVDGSPGDADESRVTRFGRLLRNCHLDELPQLWNVLRGDMTLIGPRPEMLDVERWAVRHIPGFADRLVLRPGITGLAQVTQGYAPSGVLEAYREKLAINRRYLARLSLRTDLAITMQTVVWMLQRRGWRWREQGAARGC